MTQDTPPGTPPDTGGTVPAAPASSTPPSGSTPDPNPPSPPANPDPAPTPPANPPADDGSAFKLPDAYKDKPWAAKIKTEEDLWKAIDNAQSLIGKKSIVPDLSKMTDAEREEYYAQTRPASPDDYKFGEGTPDEMKRGMSESLMKHGVTAHQANSIIADYQAMEKALVAEQFNPEGMKAAMKEAFGDEWESITGKSRNALKGVVADTDFEAIDQLPNQYISLMYRIMGNVVQKFGITESSAHTDAQGGKVGETDPAKVRADIDKELSALTSRPHTAAEKQALLDKRHATFVAQAKQKKA